ncbi:hypothetical protein MSS93_17240 (plasmid) [Deinococcus radiodurans]|nr:hypothetical protein MSS93_17240 [Deinococcus radiodurans]
MLFPALRYELRDASATGEARRGAAELARSLELSEVRQGELAIIVTELASNVIKHAGEGEILLQARTVGGRWPSRCWRSTGASALPGPRRCFVTVTPPPERPARGWGRRNAWRAAST